MIHLLCVSAAHTHTLIAGLISASFLHRSAAVISNSHLPRPLLFIISEIGQDAAFLRLVHTLALGKEMKFQPNVFPDGKSLRENFFASALGAEGTFEESERCVYIKLDFCHRSRTPLN